MPHTSEFWPSFTIIVPTTGKRATLERTLASIRGQKLSEADRPLIVMDNPPHNDWGAWARRWGIAHAGGDYLLFMDDDDEYVPGAFEVMRRAIRTAPGQVHIFRMERLAPFNDVIWKRQDLSIPGEAGTGMIAVPNDDRLGVWTNRYEGDFDFLTTTIANHDKSPVWHKDVIAIYHYNGSS